MKCLQFREYLAYAVSIDAVVKVNILKGNFDTQVNILNTKMLINLLLQILTLACVYPLVKRSLNEKKNG